MAILLFIAGCIMFVLGIGYFLQPKLILRFNAFMRDTFFKDSVVLLSSRRVGMLLLLMALLFLLLTIRFR